MQANNIIQLLENTLNPTHLHQAQNTLMNSFQNQDFITQLLVIGCDEKVNITIRQAALIHIKNALKDLYKERIKIPENDFETIKGSILQALIRNCQEKRITPTLRQIIYVLAQQQFPHNWTNIIPEIANNIQNSTEFNEIYGSVQALKAIVSAFGKEINQKVTLQNLCNKIILPLLGLAAKLFQNYNISTSMILISVFKIFSTITYFHIPEIVTLNMHSWMIFIKKLLDLNIDPNAIDRNMYQLKKICLRILFRFYQRHMNKKYSDCSPQIIDQFHSKYTKGIVESLLLQIMNEAQMSRNTQHRNFLQLTKFSLSCLSYIYEQFRESAILIDNYKEKIIYLCLERYRAKSNKNYTSFEEFCHDISQQRRHFLQFIRALLKNSTKYKQQMQKGNTDYSGSANVAMVLGNLFNHIEKGDMEVKELCLYIFSHIASLLPQVDHNIDQKMQAFIINYVKPLLKSSQVSNMIKIRCCQILANYTYVQIPQTELTQLGEGVYGCLISSNNTPDPSSTVTFLQIYAVHAFNSLLRYDFIINFTAGFLNNILQVYTSLLEIQTSMIKCLQDMLDRFENYLQPYGQQIIEMLIQMFFKYGEMNRNAKNQPNKDTIKSNYTRFSKKRKNISEDDDEQDEFEVDDLDEETVDNNFLNASKACLSAVRQIILAAKFKITNHQPIHRVLIEIFTDKQELNTEQGFNILNQIIFKTPAHHLPKQYNIYFPVIIFGMIPVPQQLILNLRNRTDSYSKTLLDMIQCICLEPDSDFISNTIGCLRNYIAKFQQATRNIHFQPLNLNYLEMLLKTAQYVHQNQSKKATISDRSTILTIYISLVEWKALNDSEVKDLLQIIGSWLNMEKEAMETQKSQNPTQKITGKFGQQTTYQQQPIKTTYCPIYVQIILLCVHFYPQITLKQVFNSNANWILSKIVQNLARFRCDYEISRFLIGFGDLLQYHSINDLNLCEKVINGLPDIIERQCKLRLGEEKNDVQSIDEEAEEDQYFGQDENTHILGWKHPLPHQTNQQDEGDQDSQEDDEWDQQFNKYYESPLDTLDQISYICQILKSSQCAQYLKLMKVPQQQKLSYLVTNMPPKNPQNQSS